ncbi:MAG: hypothetical protein MJ137_07495 [Clostridia bacterium]|nr:hypothetical protein [Clostridia bacterium]
MKLKSKKLILSVVCILLSVWMFALLPVGALGSGYYNDYSTICEIKDKTVNSANCCSMQGIAVGSSYIYTAKTDTDNTTCIIRKTKISDGTTNILKFGTNEYTTVLGHANDMDVCSINGYSTLFVATMKTGSYSLAKIKVDGNTASVQGHYTLTYGGKNKSISGIAIYSNDKTNKKTTLLCKSGADFYKVTIPWSSNSGTYTLTKAFSVNRNSVKVNGANVNTSESAGFDTQGIAYHGGYVYYPLTKGNVSIVAVYKVSGATSSSTLTSISGLSFRITSNAYSNLFEIESVGIGSDGKLYFNTNRRAADSSVSGYANHDGIHRFKNGSGDYVF